MALFLLISIFNKIIDIFKFGIGLNCNICKCPFSHFRNFMKYYILIFLYLVYLSVNAHTFQKFIHLTTHYGLSSNRAWHVFEDSKGFTWISTTDGLSRYDGHSFKNFFQIPGDTNSLCGNVIANVQERSDGKILIGTSHGISEFDPSSNSFRTIYVPPSPPNLEYTIGISQILIDHKNRVWIATQQALYCLDSNYKNIDFPTEKLYGGKFVFRVLEDSEGNVWVNQTGYLNKIKVTGSSFTIENHQTNPNNKLYTISCIDYQITNQNQIISLSNSREVFRSDLNGNTAKLFDVHVESDVNFGQLSLCSKNKLWLISTGDGVFQYDYNGNLLEHFNHIESDPASLCWNEMKDVVEDSHGNTWFCTEGGLDVLPLTKIPVQILCTKRDQDKTKFIKKPLNAFIATDTSTWCAEWGGSICHHQLNSGIIKWYDTGPQDGMNYIIDMLNVNGSLWFGTFSGLHRLDPSSGKIEKLNLNIAGFPVNDTIPVNGFYRDRQGKIWMSLGKGKGILQTDSLLQSIRHFSNKDSSENYFPFRNFSSVMEDSLGRIWMGNARSKGIAMFDYSTGKFEYRLGKNGVGFDDQVNCFFSTNNSIWIGTNSGVQKFNQDLENPILFTRMQGLPSNNINSIASDKKHRMWIATVNGLAMLDSSETQVIVFKELDGLPEDEIFSLYFDAQKNNMMCLAESVLFSFNPDSIVNSTRPVRPVLLALKVMGKDVPVKNNTTVEVGYLDKYITIEYTTPAFGIEDKLFYSYKLEGFDTNWIFLGQHQSISFTDLNAGEYNFRLRSSADRIHWQETERPLKLLVNAPFYRKVWFIALATMLLIIMIVSIVIVYYRVKLSRILLAQKIRNKIASDLHDDIGSSLSSISYMTELVKMKSGKQESASENYLNRIGETSRRLIDNMSDIVWSVNPENDAAESLIQRMKYFIAENLKLKEIHYTFEVEPGIEVRKFTMEERRNVYLIFKEIMHNILKHSQCSKVEIQISSQSEKISISIQDNGIGFSPENKHEGNGLKNIQKRTQELGAELTIHSEPGNGARFLLYV